MHKFDDAAHDEPFDYGSEAELFSTGPRKSRRLPEYKRFARAGDAIQFAIESLPPQLLNGTYLEVDEVRFDAAAIRRLYDNTNYPFVRAAAGPPR
jgi:hypothetical protein